ncbi:MAG: hypothetical protein RIT45_1060 [Pseudomonadota bacterium]|jgi:sirohydrochlorin cobaltochelatase
MRAPTSIRLALFAHGSPNPRWADGLAPLVDALQAELGAGAVRLCFLEHLAPSLLDVVAEAATDGIDEVRILPLFWSGRGHVLRDLPERVAAAAEAHPSVRVRVLPAAGEQPGVHHALADLARAGLGDPP